MANGQKSNQRISVQRLDDEMAMLDGKLETWATHNLPQDRFSRITKPSPGVRRSAAATAATEPMRGPAAAAAAAKGPNYPLWAVDDLASGAQRKYELLSKGMTNGVDAGGDDKKQLPATTAVVAAATTAANAALSTEDGAGTSCTYCALTFADRQELRTHCQTEQHQNVIMSDEGER